MKISNRKSQYLIIILCSILIVSCDSGPDDLEVLKLATTNGYILKKEIKSKGGSKKIGETKAFSYTVFTKYIQPGLIYGYQRECPEAQCFKDVEYATTTEYLIGKDQWNEWKILDSRFLENKELRIIWRPVSAKQEDYYANY